MNLLELNLSELQEIDEINKEKLNFINSEIKKLEEFLKKSTIPSFDYILPESGGTILQWDIKLKQIIHLYNGDKIHLLGASGDLREAVYSYLQDFINKLTEENQNGNK